MGITKEEIIAINAKLEAYYEDGRNDPLIFMLNGKLQQILAMYPLAYGPESYIVIKSVDELYDWKKNGMPRLDAANVTVFGVNSLKLPMIMITLNNLLG